MDLFGWNLTQRKQYNCGMPKRIGEKADRDTNQDLKHLQNNRNFVKCHVIMTCQNKKTK
jgi:hypothetical protein